MDYAKSIQSRNENIGSTIKRKPVSALYHILDCNSSQILHDNIAGIIGPYTIVDLYNAHSRTELSQFFCLTDKLFQPCSKQLFTFSRICLNGRAVRASGRKSCRIIFFYSHGTIQYHIFANIGDSKASVSKRFSDIITVIQNGARRQEVRYLKCRAILVPTVWAGVCIILDLLHAGWTEFHGQPPTKKQNVQFI